jgi:hypothetical protein
MRYLFEISSEIDDFDNREWRDLIPSNSSSTQITNWFWDHIMNNFSGSELLAFQAMIFKDIVQSIDNDSFWDGTYTTLGTLAPKMARSNLLLDEILMGNIDALVSLWDWLPYYEKETQKSGSRYITFLMSLGIDFKRSIEAELQKLPGGILQDRFQQVIDRKILFYQDEQQAWILRWEWVLDEEVPGYDLLLEFPLMTFDGCNPLSNAGWPFFTPNWDLSNDDRYQSGPKWDARRARRLAKTARKELARTGQKRPRSRMPGAWI